MPRAELTLRFAAELRLFLAPRNRGGEIHVRCDDVSTVGHVVESLGIPLPEVGGLLVNGELQPSSYRPRPGDLVLVEAVRRPQPHSDSGFILDVHLGGLARRMRLVGLDAAYANDLDDDVLIELANAGRRVLLTKDRGLLQRRRLWLGAYVRGERPDEQLADVLNRFEPSLAPWTRCMACNGSLSSVPKHAVEERLLPGTRRTYEEFSRCDGCGRVYWRGAHSRRLSAIIDSARSRS